MARMSPDQPRPRLLAAEIAWGCSHPEISRWPVTGAVGGTELFTIFWQDRHHPTTPWRLKSALPGFGHKNRQPTRATTVDELKPIAVAWLEEFLLRVSVAEGDTP